MYDSLSFQNSKKEIFSYYTSLPKIWLRLPYLGKPGENLFKTLIKKICQNLNKAVEFIIVYGTKKISYFISNKDKIPELSRNNAV